MSKQQFQTEVNQLLQLIVHSLYSHPEIFLRELISNSSDALDKLRYLTITDEKYKALVGNGIDPPRIDLELDEANRTLTVSDTGIGMNEEDLASHLGTIARSGTKNFLAQLSGDARKDTNLIGQFGVGFYSVFMVADKVEVISRKAGEDKTFKWTSDGKTGFDLEEVSEADARQSAGTTVLIHFNDEGAQYANGWRLTEIVKKYSNHIAFPIFLTHDKSEWNAEKKESIKTRTTEQVNAASAMWQRPKPELKEGDYKEFYKSITGDWEDPLFWFHTRAEGTLEYTTLFYIPAKAPLDLYQADYKGGVKLYVKRVFIMDDSKDLLPQYLRFVRGIIDSEDLPLNVSREILQQNKVLTSIKTASVKKILSELKTIATNDPEKYSQFIAEYIMSLFPRPTSSCLRCNRREKGRGGAWRSAASIRPFIPKTSATTRRAMLISVRRVTSWRIAARDADAWGWCIRFTRRARPTAGIVRCAPGASRASRGA